LLSSYNSSRSNRKDEMSISILGTPSNDEVSPQKKIETDVGD
jgi:hypothetical protein